jgi:hypothetical protein
LNKWISLVPFPLSGGYLLTSFLIGFTNIELLQVLPFLAGIVIFILVDYFMLKKSLKIMNEVIISRTDSKIKNFKVSSISDVSVTVVSPIKAYFKRDKSMILRDMQTIMFLIIPIILPWVPFFIMLQPGSGFDEIEPFAVMELMYCIMGASMNILGLTSVEKTGATINASLPIIVRDQVKARLKWAFTIIPLGTLLPVIMYIGKPIFWNILVIQISITIVGLLIGTFTLLLSIRLFGKMKNKYVLDDVQLRYKIAKNILIVVIDLVISILITIGFVILVMSKNLFQFSLIIFPIELVLALSLYFVYNRMFPKPK